MALPKSVVNAGGVWKEAGLSDNTIGLVIVDHEWLPRNEVTFRTNSIMSGNVPDVR